jgi:hypothetical protein
MTRTGEKRRYKRYNLFTKFTEPQPDSKKLFDVINREQPSKKSSLESWTLLSGSRVRMQVRLSEGTDD